MDAANVSVVNIRASQLPPWKCVDQGWSTHYSLMQPVKFFNKAWSYTAEKEMIDLITSIIRRQNPIWL